MRLVLVLFCLICSGSAYRIGLVSIVKDEMLTLPRLLKSVKNHVDIYLFCDTGSTDGTADFLERYIADNGLEGFVARHPWYDFGTNRNMCLDEIHNYLPAVLRPDYLLLPDADFELVVKDPKWADNIKYDCNEVAYEGGPLYYRQILLVNARKTCSYIGVTHEYISCSDVNSDGELDITRGKSDDIAFIHHRDGGNRAEKFERDEQMLKDHLQTNPSDTRSIFYLAQTLENLEKYDEAIVYYSLRAKAGGFYEEVWYSLYKIGLCKMKRGDSSESYVNDLLGAYDYVPSRSEPLFYLVQSYRNEKKYGLCIMLGLFGNTLPMPTEQQLFVETSIYQWQFKDELSQCLYWKGSFEDSKLLIEDLLKDPNVPPGQKDRISGNLVYTMQKLDELDPITKVVPKQTETSPDKERKPREQFHKNEL